jgi:chromatin assembly factor 1 subunit B
VATTDQILFYSTDSILPIAIVGNIHYAPINDMTWSSNKKLIACSSDGYCSIITFANEEAYNVIGTRLNNNQIENEELK